MHPLIDPLKVEEQAIETRIYDLEIRLAHTREMIAFFTQQEETTELAPVLPRREHKPKDLQFVKLGPTQAEIFAFLKANANVGITLRNLVDHFWQGYEERTDRESFANRIYSTLSRIRKDPHIRTDKVKGEYKTTTYVS